jgi:hypothetical protein
MSDVEQNGSKFALTPALFEVVDVRPFFHCFLSIDNKVK